MVSYKMVEEFTGIAQGEVEQGEYLEGGDGDKQRSS